MKKKYDHLLVEKNKDRKWQQKKYFSLHDKSKPAYAILLPPPNVTGKLHLGHAWDGVIQDTLIRYNKLQGKDVMWIPGMDHAGIATQAKVEEKLTKNNIFRQEIGREAFIKKTWEWKEDYAQQIRKQWSKLGLALDYPNEKFTLDKTISQAVQKVFVDLYKRKLVYRDKKPINWDPKLQTVLSNIEVQVKDTPQDMVHISYPIKGGGEITIATVRPETLFSDVAVAVHPDNPKFKKLIGKKAIHPLTHEELPIIADEQVEIDKGTGAMKVSAHSEVDFYILQKHNLPIRECIDKNGKMNSLAIGYEGLDRFKVRKDILHKLRNQIVKIEKVLSPVGYSERSNVPIEILVQPQWFIKMKPLSRKILDDLDSGQGINFKPAYFENTLRKWMEKIHDWCISRQLWWGHRIPAWYKNNEVKVQEKSPGKDWVQDEDVLDTWFSSGIAPFTFLGWPQRNEMLAKFYPSATLVTGYDIIFFWVARMYFQSLDIMKEKPFNDVLIHGLIRAEDGKKMSKSLNNGVDPMEVIQEFGSDALRWFFLINSTPGQDIRFSPTKLKAAWNLNNKIWNIARYILEVMPNKNGEISKIDKWIETKLAKLIKLINDKMINYQFTIIGKALLHFITDDFSSWYVEMSKNAPNKTFAISILQKFMIVLHPFLPFISDHIYFLTSQKELLDQKWPQLSISSTTKVEQAIKIVKVFREFRHKFNISNKIHLSYYTEHPLSPIEKQIVNNLAFAKFIPNEGEIVPCGKIKFHILIPHSTQIQIDKIRKQKIVFLKKEILRVEELLQNSRFLAKAPKEKITLERNKLKNFQKEIEALK